ncbi:TPA_asm: RNA-directed RNA polymerase, partial [ssRNA phage EMS014]
MSTKSAISTWADEISYEDSIRILTNLAREHAKKAGPFEKDIVTFLSSRDFAALCDYELTYDASVPVDNYINARQALAFFQKLEPLELNIDKESVAYKKFVECEDLCRETNIRLRSLRQSGNYPTDVSSILFLATQKIAKIVSDVPSLERLDFTFGPGANTSVKASASSPRHKLGARLACSAEAVQYAASVLAELPHMAMLHADMESDVSFYVSVEIHAGKVQFVPKTAKTFRTICVEPILNSIAQKGIGKFLRARLAKYGVDLSDQTRNQKLARLGSLDGSLATIDCSSASDLISKEIVAELLPYDWYSLLSHFRTGNVTYKGQPITLEKFSSMGNAYTFELETVIFYGLAHSVCAWLGLPTTNVSVYGDDIIVPTEAYETLVRVMEFCGFLVNTKKSYSSGPFRESCGKDYFLGVDIRPYYQKSLVSGQTLFVLHNFYVRNFEFRMAKKVLKYIHPDLRIYGPDGYGDGHLLGDWQPKRSKRTSRSGWEGGVFDTFVLKSRRNIKPVPGDRILPVYSIYVRPDEAETFLVPSDHFVVRGSAGVKRISIYT